MRWSRARGRSALRAVIVGGIVALGSSLGLAPSSGASGASTNVVTVGEAPGSTPNFIFPFETTAHFSITNIVYFQHYMFRPLYMFGGHASVAMDTRLSIADEPVFSNDDRTAKITLKHYEWSNGTAVDATDVLFWLNIWHQKPTGYGSWAPGGLSIPTSITQFTITSASVFTITFDRSLNPQWLVENQLSLITPLPLAWTRTSTSGAAGSAGCATAPFGTADAACKSVYDYLSEQSGFNPTNPKETIDALPTYATNPLWQVVDGPWVLSSFQPTGDVVFKPNTSYSGPNKPKIKEYIERPFTSGSSEFDALAAGTIDIGYLPRTDVISSATQSGRPGHEPVIGKNNPRLETYVLVPNATWGIDFASLNFKSTGDTGNAGAILSQLYVRQAMQRLINQTLYVRSILKGYGVDDYGPVPPLPDSAYLSSDEMHNLYPYSPSVAKSLLTSHGWEVKPHGASVCERPGDKANECGRGIPKGAKLAFTFLFGSGTQSFATLFSAEKASWAQVGIDVTLEKNSFDTVIGTIIPCPNGCAWQMGSWDSGWFFVETSYPTGNVQFASGGADNEGLFATSVVNAEVKATDTTTVTLKSYENRVAREVPVLWEPQVITLVEVHKGLLGVTPEDPLLSLTPATFHWS